MKKEIPGYEGLYSITEKGKVINHKTNKEMKCSEVNGYRKINLSKEGKKIKFSIHRLVATAFLWNPDELPQVDHIDENKENNHVDNLRWCNQQQNCKWHIELNPNKKINKNSKPVIVGGVKFSSAYFAAKHIAADSGKNPQTISKEIRRRHLRDGHNWLMYNKYKIGY